MESDPKHAAKTTQEFLRKGEFSRYCLIVHIYTNLSVYATIHTTGDKLSEFQERDHASKHALSGSYPNVISQFYKLVVLIFVPHPPSFFKIPSLLHFSLVQGDLPGPGSATSPLRDLPQSAVQFTFKPFTFIY